jgi:hypothetical protein
VAILVSLAVFIRGAPLAKIEDTRPLMPSFTLRGRLARLGFMTLLALWGYVLWRGLMYAR